jgi:hypothetical protein
MVDYVTGIICCLWAKYIKTKKEGNKEEKKSWKKKFEVLVSKGWPNHPSIADDYQAILGGIHVNANFTW